MLLPFFAIRDGEGRGFEKKTYLLTTSAKKGMFSPVSVCWLVSFYDSVKWISKKNKKSVIMLTCNRANFKLSIIKISVVKRKKTAFYFHKCVFLYLHEGLFSSNVGKQQCKNTQKDFQSRSIHGTICRFPL